jgi:hypothetical protein
MKYRVEENPTGDMGVCVVQKGRRQASKVVKYKEQEN